MTSSLSSALSSAQVRACLLAIPRLFRRVFRSLGLALLQAIAPVGVFQAEPGAKKLQPIEKLYGLFVSHARTLRLGRLQRAMVDVVVGSRDESLEQRMRFVWLALKFRMKLACDKERVVFQFNDFHQFAIRRNCQRRGRAGEVS